MTDKPANNDGNEMEGLLIRLRKEHRDLDAKIVELTSRPYLTPEDQVEVARLKKMKLSKKDRMLAVADDLGVDL